MRKLVWFLLFAVAMLFVGTSGDAFAHAAHQHAQHQQTQSAQAPAVETSDLASHVSAKAEFSVTAQTFISGNAGDCPHGKSQADCGFCCACAVGAVAALAAPELAVPAPLLRAGQGSAASGLLVRQHILDLSRPPKSFV